MSTRNALHAKKVIVEIIRQAGGSLNGVTRLYKAFYFAHLFYAQQQADFLTDWPIVRMPNGPGIDAGDELLNELVAIGALQRGYQAVGPYRATVYSLTAKKLPGEELSPGAIDAVKRATEFVQQFNASELSSLTHEYSRSWNKTPDGHEMNIYIDPIQDEDYEARRRSLEHTRSAVAKAASRFRERV